MGIAQQIPNMIIWGGPRADTIRGNPDADNVIHGAQGNDKIFAVGQINSIYGDGGTDTVVFQGARCRYTVTRRTSDGSAIVVRRRGAASQTHVTTLYDVEFLQFRDGTVSTALPGHTHKPPRDLARSHRTAN